MARCLTGSNQRIDAETETLIPCQGGFFDEAAHTLKADGFDASEDGTGRQNLIPVTAGTLKANNGGGGFGSDPSETFVPVVAPCLTGNYGKQPDSSDTNAGPMLAAVAFAQNQLGEVRARAVAIGWSEELTASEELAGTIQYGGQGGRHDGVMTPSMAVRRLTPTECCRLQGFPDKFLHVVPVRGKTPPPDGPMYKALGNSFAVPVIRYIGERIEEVTRV